MTKPDYIEEIPREAYIAEMAEGLGSLRETIDAERKFLSADHTRNLAPAQRLSFLWGQYVQLVARIVEVRSLPEEHYTFFKDHRQGQLGYKGVNFPWGQATGGPQAHEVKGLGPSGTEGAYR